MNLVKRLAGGALLLLLLGTVVGAVLARGDQPLSEADLVKRIQVPLDDDAIVAELQKKGVAFALDAEAKERLQKAGASAAVLTAVQKAAEARRPGTAVTYADVLTLLQKGAAEKDLLKRLEESPTVFTLDDRQVEELKKAGASDKLLAVMRENRSVAGKHTDVTAFAVILDCSGSMKEKTKDGPSKMDVAKEVVTKLIHDIPNGMDVTFLVYGTDAKAGCEDVQVVRPLGPLNDAAKVELTKYINGLDPVGNTPIALALRKAGEQLAKSKGISELILITDGMESCNGDPAKEAAALAKSLNLRQGVSIIGLGVQPEERAAIAKIAEEGKGKYYGAETGKDLARVISEAVDKKIVEPIESTTPAELSPDAKALAQKLKSKDVAVRRAAAVDLGKLNEKAVLPILIEALNDKDMTVRATVAADLQALADTAAVPALMKRVADDVWGDDEVYSQSKAAAYNALKALNAEKLTESLAAALKSKNETVRVWACQSMAALTDDKAAVQALVDVMHDKVEAVRVAAADSLGKLADPAAAPILIGALKDKCTGVRMTAAASLSKVADKGDKDAVAALVKRVADDVYGEDEFYAQSKNTALAALKALDANMMTPALADALKSKNETVRGWASSALGLQSNDKDAVDVLGQAMSDKVATVRTAAATALGKLADPSSGPVLIKALEDKDLSVRTTAAASLSKVADKGDKDAVAALVKRVADDVYGEDEFYAQSKNTALAALKALDANMMTPALADALKSKNETVRGWASSALGLQSNDKDAVTTLSKALTDKAARVRTFAAAALQKLADKDAVPALVKRVADDVLEGDPAEKNAALAALNALDPDKVKGALTTASQSTNAAVKDWAVAQLAAIKDK